MASLNQEISDELLNMNPWIASLLQSNSCVVWHCCPRGQTLNAILSSVSTFAPFGCLGLNPKHGIDNTQEISLDPVSELRLWSTRENSEYMIQTVGASYLHRLIVVSSIDALLRLFADPDHGNIAKMTLECELSCFPFTWLIGHLLTHAPFLLIPLDDNHPGFVFSSKNCIIFQSVFRAMNRCDLITTI